MSTPSSFPLLPYLLDGGAPGGALRLPGRATDGGLGSLVLEGGAHRASGLAEHLLDGREPPGLARAG